MLAIAYWSSEVKYETVGKDRLMTHLNETLVKSKVYVVCNLFWGRVQSTANIVKPETVMRNMRK